MKDYRIGKCANFQVTIAFYVFLIVLVSVKTASLNAQNSPPNTYSDLFISLDENGQKRTVVTEKDWEFKRDQILQGMQKAMGKFPDTTYLPPMNIKYQDSLKTKTYTRYTLSFVPAIDEEVSCYLYIPIQKKTKKKVPAMLVLHGTNIPYGKGAVDGKGSRPHRFMARELAERGYVVIAPDYPSMGEQIGYDFDKDRYESGTMKGIFNHIRCVDLLTKREDVDSERIGVIGHSLGGHNSMFIGAFDTRLKVIVSSCGWTILDYYKLPGRDLSSKLGPYGGERYMPLYQKYYLEENRKPFELDELIATLAPRAFFSNSPIGDDNFDVRGVRIGISSAAKVYQFLDAESKLQIHYPDAGHDFPLEIRLKAYDFIDAILEHHPNEHKVNWSSSAPLYFINSFLNIKF